MEKKMLFAIFLGLLYLFSDACISGGTHGSIKSYQYAISKSDLEQHIWSVIGQSKKICRDTLKEYDGSVNYYNDGTKYFTIHVFEKNVDYKFVVRYYGDSAYWDTSRQSEIFIAFATENGKGGSAGHNDFTGENRKIKQRIIDVFEREFIDTLEKMIGNNHEVNSE